VTCSQCKTELPDKSLFCPQCGRPQNDVAKSLVRAKTPTWAVVLAFLSFALVAYVVVHLMNDAKKENATAIEPRAAAAPNTTEPILLSQLTPPQPRSLPIGNGSLVVKAGSYSSYALFVPGGVTRVTVTGRFTASGGSGNDIMAYLLDEDGFVNFKNGHAARAFYNSGKVTEAAIGAVLPTSSGVYYLVFDNRFSAITPKAVTVSATLNYMQ
jgi:hypothetical protein